MLRVLERSAKKRILLYCRGTYQFDLLVPIIKANPEIEFYLHSNRVSEVEFTNSALRNERNAYFIRRYEELVLRLELFGTFITTDAQAANAHAYSLHLIQMFNRLHVPVYELQHGMFQLGVHYYDVPCGVRFSGDSLPSTSFAQRMLVFSPIGDVSRVPFTVIGYPPHSGKSQAKVPSSNSYILVMTNLNWPTYTDDERRNFYSMVFSYASEHPENSYVWRQHPAEARDATCIRLRREMGEKYPSANGRIIFSRDSQPWASKSVEELVIDSQWVISSISTVLLDCERIGKRVAVYVCESVACLGEQLKEKTVFTKFSELNRIAKDGPGRFESGLLREFDNNAFRDEIFAHYKLTDLTRPQLLSCIFSDMQVSGSELGVRIDMFRREVREVIAGMRCVRNDFLEKLSGLSMQIDAINNRLQDLSNKSSRTVKKKRQCGEHSKKKSA